MKDTTRQPMPVNEPFAAVYEFDHKGTRVLGLALFLALAIHGTAGARAAIISLDLLNWSQSVRARIADQIWASYDVDLLKLAPPEPPKEEPKEEPKEPAKATPPREEEIPPPHPPAAAQAGKILAAEPDPNE